MLQRGALINGVEKNSLGSLLNNAVIEGHTEIVKLLLERGAMASELGTTPKRAAASGCLDILNSLMNHVANIDACSPTYSHTPLAIVSAIQLAQLRMFSLLRSRGAVLNTVETSFRAFKAAIEEGLEPIVVLLLENEVGITSWDADTATRHGRDSIAQILRKHTKQRRPQRILGT